jgi:hypothetical protein
LAGDHLVVEFPIRSRSDLGWVIPVARPIFDRGGKMQAVLAVAIFADSLREIIGTDELPEASIVRVVTENEIEVVLFSSKSAVIAPDASRMGSAVRQFRLAEGSEVIHLHNNLTRIVGFSRTRRVPWLVTVGLPVEPRSLLSADLQ